ncbi:hypothetical protein [Actinopolymorpha singaporensis]|uniref:Uncharacterized protein n=1 Tax=Actinopolymorpha singaporensis TaxID=117157 RepID=A0A1H1Y6A0_9ACTN|nr:hypothetical protein [Actinopolymorpha singaporensis]SDT16759.1 hypothetical protein SAMN04489717_5309 [Actinopolymorpha singaporensis]
MTPPHVVGGLDASQRPPRPVVERGVLPQAELRREPAEPLGLAGLLGRLELPLIFHAARRFSARTEAARAGWEDLWHSSPGFRRTFVVLSAGPAAQPRRAATKPHEDGAPQGATT